MKHYRYLHGRDRTLTCDLGCKHRAGLFEVVDIEETGTKLELIPHLNYTTDGYGHVRFGKDQHGRTYTKTPDWSGGGLWVRDDDEDAIYWTSPVPRLDVCLNIDNNDPIG